MKTIAVLQNSYMNILPVKIFLYMRDLDFVYTMCLANSANTTNNTTKTMQRKTTRFTLIEMVVSLGLMGLLLGAPLLDIVNLMIDNL